MELATLHFDTYKAVTLLKERGYTKKQAEGFIDVMQEVTLSGVATKQDVQNVRDELKEDIATTKNEMLKFQIIQTIAIVGVMVALFQIF